MSASNGTQNGTQGNAGENNWHVCTQIWAPATGDVSNSDDDNNNNNTDNDDTAPIPGDGPQSEAVLSSVLWPNGSKITVNIQGATPFINGKIQQFAHVWEQYANITFVFTNDVNAQLRIAVNNNGSSWSYIGTGNLNIAKPNPTMNFGWFTDQTHDDEFSRVVVHEFGHALGCIHEQASPLANIPWNKPVVYDWYLKNLKWDKAQVDFQVFSVYPQNGVYETLFDRTSIMEYSYPPEFTLDHSSAPTNHYLSDSDKTFIMKCYPRSGPRRTTQDGIYLVNCFNGTQRSSGIAYYKNMGNNDGKQPDDYIDVLNGNLILWEGKPGSVKFKNGTTINWSLDSNGQFEPTFSRVGSAKNEKETWNVYKDRYRLLYSRGGWDCYTVYWAF